ncbi:hypothetical protein [Streptomyces deserti]
MGVEEQVHLALLLFSGGPLDELGTHFVENVDNRARTPVVLVFGDRRKFCMLNRTDAGPVDLLHRVAEEADHTGDLTCACQVVQQQLNRLG